MPLSAQYAVYVPPSAPPSTEPSPTVPSGVIGPLSARAEANTFPQPTTSEPPTTPALAAPFSTNRLYGTLEPASTPATSTTPTTPGTTSSAAAASASVDVGSVITSSSYAALGATQLRSLAAADPTASDAIFLTGNEFAQIITGNAGANTINGGSGGPDTLVGLRGDDVFLVRSLGDMVVEANGEGFDTIYTTVSYNLGANEVEVLSTVRNDATDAIDLIGNYATQTIVGNYGANVLNGGSGGVDTLIGLFGDDIYAIGDSRTVIVEQAGQGYDTVVASADYTLAAGVSIEVLAAQNRAGSTALALRGNEFAQLIAGNNGANVIDGGSGADTLIGGGGADSFRFTTTLGASNIDAIVDFEAGVDRIALSRGVFASLGANVTAANFVVGSAATTADQYLIYDSATGRLLYDADGSGTGAAVVFALVTPGLAITAGSFETIAPASTV